MKATGKIVRLLSLGALILLSTKLQAQDPQFTQFYSAPLYISPSMAGGTPGGRAVLNFRDQWPSIPNAFITTAASVDYSIYAYYSGVGLSVLHDQAGTGQLARSQVALSYAYFPPKINRYWQIRPGLQIKYGRSSLNYSKLTFVDQLYTGSASSIEELTIKPANYIDAAASLLAFSERNWVGITVDHLTQPNQSVLEEGESIIPLTTRVYGGTRFSTNNRFGRYDEESLVIAFHYKAQGKYDQFDLGAYFYKRPIIIGMWYRGLPGLKQPPGGYLNHDMLALLIGYKNDFFHIGYSYDFTMSKLVNSSGGAHEISFIYLFMQNIQLKAANPRRSVPCAKITL